MARVCPERLGNLGSAIALEIAQLEHLPFALGQEAQKTLLHE
jgi:hypothetical protein